MLKREQSSNLLGIFATCSIITVGYAIGGTIGQAVMAGIGINLWSDIIQGGAVKLKERWLCSNDGIRNHNIQLALSRAFIKALASLEKKYFKLDEANALPKDEKKSIKVFFKELREQAQTTFPSYLEKAADGLQIKDFLYGNQDTTTDKLLEGINRTDDQYNYSDNFRDFLRQNLLNEVLSFFNEELKTDSKECNKAWRAFQRLLLEGIQADVNAVKASHEVIQQDLQKLDVLRSQLDQLKDTIDRRLSNEPFQEGLEKAIITIHTVLNEVAKTAHQTEETVNDMAADIKKLVDPDTKAEIPKIPDDIRSLLKEGWNLRNIGNYEEARIVFQKSLELAKSYKHNRAMARAKRGLAIILNEWDKNPADAKILLQECLLEFRSINSEMDIATTLFDLGSIEIEFENLDVAKAYLDQALELDKKLEDKQEIAQVLHQMGWIEDRRGNSSEALNLTGQALTYLLSVYQEGDPETKIDAIHDIAGCYHHKALIYEHGGNVAQAESNYMRALDWDRMSGFKPDVGKTLYLLARLKYREAQYDAGNQFLDEATAIYSEIGDHVWHSKCLDLKGRYYFTIGQTDKATAIFETALNAVKKSGDCKDQEEYLNKLGHAYLEARKIKKAKKYFERARDLSVREGLLDGYAGSVKNLAQIAQDTDERNKLLSDGIQTLEKLLLSTQAEPKRAFITGQIGFFYEGMENFQQALVYYQKAKKAFESLADIGGIGKCLDSIAHIKGILGNINEAFDTYRELKKLIDGTPYYELIAGTAINLGEIQMRIGNLDEAKMLFQDAELLCRRYNLRYLPHVRKSIKRLQEQIDLRKPPELNFKQLIDELFELVDWFPEAKDSLFRLWMCGRKEALIGNYRNTNGIKFMLCQDDVDTFLGASKILHPYSDLCLQAVSSEYPGAGLEIIPFPGDKKIFFECGIEFGKKILNGVYTLNSLSGGILPRYHLASDTTRSEATGNEGVTIVGWSPGLPDQAHQLILSRSVEDLTSQKIFFFPYERHLAHDKLLSDISLSKEFGFVPVYFESLPNSESIEVMTSSTIDIPVMLPNEVEHQRKQIRKVKFSLSQLMSVTKESARSALNNFKFEIDELSDICVSKRLIKIQVYILDFPGILQREFYVVFVITDNLNPIINNTMK